MIAAESFSHDTSPKAEKISLPDRGRTNRRFQGALVARHRMAGRGSVFSEITLWRRSPRGWAVGLSWSDGVENGTRAALVDTIDAAMQFVEAEGPVCPLTEQFASRTKSRLAKDPTEALMRPFLRRQTAVELRRLYGDLVGRTLLDWQAGLPESSEGIV